MYKDKFNFKGDHNSVAEELFSEVTSLEEKLLAIEESVNEGYFTLDEAIVNYNVEYIEYLQFAISRLNIGAKNESIPNQAFQAISTVIRVFNFPINHVFNPKQKEAIVKIERVIAQGSVRTGTKVAKAGDLSVSAKIVDTGAKTSIGAKVVSGAKNSSATILPRKKSMR